MKTAAPGRSRISRRTAKLRQDGKRRPSLGGLSSKPKVERSIPTDVAATSDDNIIETINFDYLKPRHAARLADFEVAFRAGNKSMALRAIYLCLLYEQPVPKWAIWALGVALGKNARASAGSWDDVFGRPYAANRKLAAIHNRKEKAWLVRAEVIHLRAEKRRARRGEDDVFAEVAKKFGMGRRSVKRYFEEYKEDDGLLSGSVMDSIRALVQQIKK